MPPRLIQKHDARPRPGDMVVLRGTLSVEVYAWTDGGDPHERTLLHRIGVARPGNIGVVLCSPCPIPTFTYVLWSDSATSGMVQDGRLRRV